MTPSKRAEEDLDFTEEVNFAEEAPRPTYEELQAQNGRLLHQLASSTAEVPPQKEKLKKIIPTVVPFAAPPSKREASVQGTAAVPSKKIKKDGAPANATALGAHVNATGLGAPANATTLPKGFVGKHHEGHACWSVEHGVGVIKGGGAVRLSVKFASIPVEKSVNVSDIFLLPS